MKIERKNINLITETFAYIYGISNEDIAAVFKMEVIKHINYINSLLDVDFKTLSDGNFYNLLCKVYNIKLESEDYLKIISKKNGRKYDRCLTLDTTMLIDVLGNSEKLQDKRVYQVAYLVAVSHESEIDSNQIFSKNEIKKLIDDGDIVILQERKRPIIGNFVPREEEIYEKFFGENIDFNGHILRDENFSIVVSMLRKKFMKEKIRRDMKVYLIELQGEIDEIVSHVHSNDLDYREVANRCVEWFVGSSEEKMYAKLLKKVSK